MARVLPTANSVKVWCLAGVIEQNIFVTFENNLGDKKLGSQIFHAAWGINQKDSCPDYDNSQINAIQELLLKS